MVVPQEVREVWQCPLGQRWPNRVESQQQGQGVGRMFGHGPDVGFGWAEAGKQSFAGWVLSVVA